ncbi:MAG: FHA domain-containing protein, partial [Acidobacteria bacterium]|nr:FHA domain-containing protein [Acidobacteriota bacterium]
MDISLVVFREGGERRDFALPEGRTLIGRQDDCDIRIPLAEVSRHHAEVTVKGDVVMLNDLDSANGTYVNNRREKAAELQP